MSPLTKNVILVAAAVATGFGLSAKPWMLARNEQASAARTIASAKADETQMVRDQTVQSRLETELGKEELLRKQGFRRVGEVPAPR